MQGSFPFSNTMEDGYDCASPVDAFPMQNKYGNSNILSVFLSILFYFLLRDAMHKRGLAVMRCLSVRLSVCLSKRVIISSKCVHHRLAIWF